MLFILSTGRLYEKYIVGPIVEIDLAYGQIKSRRHASPENNNLFITPLINCLENNHERRRLEKM